MAVSPIPPFAPNNANFEITEARVYIGGAPNFVQNAALQSGDAFPTTAAATTDQDYTAGDDYLVVDDNTAFLPTNGTINVVETRTDGSIVNHWFTYFSIASGTTFQFIRRIGGPEGPIPAGASVSQWRELTDEGITIKRYAELQGSTITHAGEIAGVNWSSQVHRQYATVYAEFRYWNSIYQTFTPWVPRMLCYLDPVRPVGFPGYSTWAANAGCESKLLNIIPTVPQQIGNIVIPYTIEADPHLENPLLEPYEGNGAQDFGPSHLYDGDRMTPYVSRDAPTTDPALPWYPTGRIQLALGNVPTDASGFGVKIHRVSVGGVGVNQQDDVYIEIVNMGPEPIGTAFQETVETDPDTGITTRLPAAQDAETWGAINLGGYALETEGCRVYLGSKNGSDEQIMLGRNATAILCRNRQKFEAQNTVPEGTVVVEYGPCDGWMTGLDPVRLHRGIGGSFALKRSGGWVALREASRGGVRFKANYNLYTPPESFVALNGDQIAANGNLVCSASIAGFTDSGYLVPQSSMDEVRIYYSGKSGTTFTGCKKVNPDRQNTLTEGVGLRQGVLADKWRDFVAWGNANDPQPFYLEQSSGDLVDQNYDGTDAHRVWGYRGPDGYTTGFTSEWHTVSPTGIGTLKTIQRKNAMGGGVYQGSIGGLGVDFFSKHDGATAMDWEETDGRPVGNIEPSQTSVLLRLKLSEFPAATVTLDDNAVTQTISVEAGTALPYPGSLLPGQRIRTNLGYDFIYGWRDDSTFHEVRKYNYAASPPFYAPGSGPTYAPGTTLTLIYDTNPSHWQRQNRAKRLEGRNSYTPAGIDIRRFQRSPAVTVQSHEGGTVTLVPGGDIMPDSGTLSATIAQSGGALYFEPFTSVVYTGVAGDSLTGVETTNGRTLPPGTTLTLVVEPARVSDCLIRISRRPNPNDPATYIGDGENPDWDNINDVRSLNSDRVYIPLGGSDRLGPVTEIAILVRKMSDGGRVKINEIVPYSVIFDPPESGGAKKRPVGGRRNDAGYIADEMLRLAGWPKNRRSCGGGPDVRGAKISSGTWWEALSEWAERTGMIVSDGPLGVVKCTPDPRVYGRPQTQSTVLRITPEAVWGQLAAEEREQFRVSQLTLEATNDVSLEHYVVTYPAQPIALGQLATPVRDKRAPSLSAAKAWVKSLVARLNGGWRLTIPIGQTDSVEPGDIIRLEVPMDEAGVLFEGIDCFVLGTEYSYRSGVQTGVLSVERWKTQ